ncbi:hypothetical protein BDN71DRAFT_1393551 [Pleurotus eryngii]|uniref:Tc1-like transposase DDE domain-containing protein n=1 Tax=Pleurotus eryngii TaxID=5323 RepID=A0A9P5ZUL3_PLEER|nr:hypothetical protein BDN71DRAFT_1393551 [Pleurotus eryngii]
MQHVLSLQSDFHNEKPLLQLIIKQAGHKCVFLPKFHCNLNPIEMVWSQLKQYFCKRADGTFPTAKKLVPECLDAVTTINICHYFQHCLRYMNAYRKGPNVKQAAYAVKKYTSHQCLGQNVMMDVNVINRG